MPRGETSLQTVCHAMHAALCSHAPVIATMCICASVLVPPSLQQCICAPVLVTSASVQLCICACDHVQQSVTGAQRWDLLGRCMSLSQGCLHCDIINSRGHCNIINSNAQQRKEPQWSTCKPLPQPYAEDTQGTL